MRLIAGGLKTLWELLKVAAYMLVGIVLMGGTLVALYYLSYLIASGAMEGIEAHDRRNDQSELIEGRSQGRSPEDEEPDRGLPLGSEEGQEPTPAESLGAQVSPPLDGQGEPAAQ